MKRELLSKKYQDTKAIGYCNMLLTNWGGLEVLDVTEKNGETALIACFNWGTTGRQNIARHVIRYTPGGRAYIRKNGWRIYLDEIMRM